MKPGFLPLEHKLLAQLRERNIVKRNLLLAVSGGLDSVCLAKLLSRLNPLLQNHLVIGHIHHGRARRTYRDRAWKLAKDLANSVGIAFLSNCREGQKAARGSLVFASPVPKNLKSEADFRDFRYSWLRRFKAELETELQEPVWLVTAHTADDLLETRLIRLIRGTGGDGLCSMEPETSELLRPLLELTRAELEDYAAHRALQWVEDPSNRDLRILRNWLRHRWLPALEKVRKGSRWTLARSLATISRELGIAKSFQPADVLVQGREGLEIDHVRFVQLGREERLSVLRSYLRAVGVASYQTSHLQEFLKRLDREEKSSTFRLLKRQWVVESGRIFVQPL